MNNIHIYVHTYLHTYKQIYVYTCIDIHIYLRNNVYVKRVGNYVKRVTSYKSTISFFTRE